MPRAIRFGRTRRGIRLGAAAKEFLVGPLSVLAALLFYYALARTEIYYSDFIVPIATGLFVGTLPVSWRTKIVGSVLAGIAAPLLFGPPVFSQFEKALLPLIALGLRAVLTAAGTGVSVALAKLTRNKVSLVIVLLVFLLSNFILTTFTLNRSVWYGNMPLDIVVSQEPIAEQYSFDGYYYLKIFYLMKQGHPFYAAQATAYDQDTRKVGVPPEGVIGWRLPAVFFLWNLLLGPGGNGIIQLFVFMSVAALISAFFLARRFLDPSIALLSSFLLAPYFLYGAVTMWFPFPEYWGAFFGIFAVTVFVNREVFLRYSEQPGSILASALAFLAAIIREHMLYIVLAGLATSAFYSKRWRSLLIWVFPMAGFALFYFVHYLNIRNYYNEGMQFRISPWWLHGGVQWIREATGFGWFFYPQRYLYPLIVVMFAAVGVQAIPDRQTRLFLTLVLLIPLVTFMFLGRQWSEYWGVILMPFALIFAPIAFSVLPHFKAGRETRCHQPSAMSVTEGS